MSRLDQLDTADVDRFVPRATSTLASHVHEMSISPAPGDLLAAIDAILGTVRELARAHPGKHDEIESLIARYASGP